MAMPRQYERLRLLGSGTFGKAWLVRESRDRGLHVLKEIPVATMTPREREQALTEVTVLSRCRHVNIIRYRDAYVSGTSLHIIMEYADGGDLHDRIENQKGVPFENEVIIDWFVQLCFALQYIHSQNILHRDLKARNIFLNSQNVVKLGDFGIARILTENETHAQTAVGTPYYLSPEICNQQPYNQRSDLWSAGCVLYELITFRPPFQAATFPALVLSIVQGEYPPLSRNCGPLLEDLVSVLLRVTARDRPTAEQVLAIPTVSSYVAKHKLRVDGICTPSTVGRNRNPHSSENIVSSPFLQPNSPRLTPSSSDSGNRSQASPVKSEKPAPDVIASSVSDTQGTGIASRTGSKKGQSGRRFSLRTPPTGRPERTPSSRATRSVDGAVRISRGRSSKHKSPRLVLFREVIARQRARSQSNALRNGGRTYSLSPGRKDYMKESKTNRLSNTAHEDDHTYSRDNDVNVESTSVDLNNNEDPPCYDCTKELVRGVDRLENDGIKPMRLLLESLELRDSTHGNTILKEHLGDMLGMDKLTELVQLADSGVTSLLDVMGETVTQDQKVWLPLVLFQVAQEKLSNA